MNGKTPEGQLAGSNAPTRVPQPTEVIVKNQPIDVKVEGQPIDVRIAIKKNEPSNLPPSFTPRAKGRAILVATQAGNDADNFVIDEVYGEWVKGKFRNVRGWFRPASSAGNGNIMIWMAEVETETSHRS